MYGGIWSLKVFRYDEQTFALSAASDGTVRGATMSCAVSAKSKLTQILELFKVQSVEHSGSKVAARNINTTTSGNTATTTTSPAVVSGVTSGFLLHVLSTTGSVFNPVGAESFTTFNAAAIHCVTRIDIGTPTTPDAPRSARANSKGDSQSSGNNTVQDDSLYYTQLIGYGGATGLLRVHSVDLYRATCSSSAVRL